MLEEPRIGVFICHCGLNIAGVIDVKKLTEYARTLPNVVVAIDNRYTCADPGQEEIKKTIKEHKLNRVVVAACSPRMHEPTFRRCVAQAGLNPYLFEMANIREFSSWCHSGTPKEATEKAKDIVKMAVAKARLLQPLEAIKVPVTNKALILGGGIAGISATLDLADMGFKVYLVEKDESIGGHMAQLDKTFPTLDCSICMLGSEEVILGDGTIVSIKDLADSILKKTEGFNPHPPTTYSFEDYEVKLSEIMNAQKLPAPARLIEVQTGTGMKLQFTPDHKIMIDTSQGPMWVRCDELKPGDRLYSPRKLSVRQPQKPWIIDLLPEDFKVADVDLTRIIRKKLKGMFGSLRKAALNLRIQYRHLQKGRWLSISELKNACKALGLDWEDVKKKIRGITYRGAIGTVQLGSQTLDEKTMYMLGLLASDGHIETKRIRFYNTNSGLVKRFIKTYKDLFPTKACCISRIKSVKKTQKARLVVQVKNKILFHISNKLEIIGNLKPVFRLKENLIAAFLRGFFDGDGSVNLIRHQNRATAKVTFCLGKDYDYAFRLHLLLKRLGIVSKIYEYGRRVIVDISERRDVKEFAKKVGSNYPKKARCLRRIERLDANSKIMGGLFEHLPLECGKLLTQLRKRYSIPLKSFPLSCSNTLRILRQDCRVTRVNMARILAAMKGIAGPQDQDILKLERVHKSFFFLDKVKKLSIVPPSDDYVYDITVKGNHSFIPKGAFVVSNCIEGPKMVDVSRHPNIEIISYADILSVEGFVGNFRVKIRKNPRYVIAENCTGCGECRDTCPIEYPNEWDMNMGVRKAISVPFDQAVPLVYTINMDYCIECYKCVDACGARQAINFDQQPEEIELDVGTIIVAIGFESYLPYTNPQYGYGKYDNVITALEFERLILAAGPTSGKVVRASDGEKPHSVVFIQCVGSRDINKYEYCSGFCCMYTLKHAVMLKEKYKDDIQIYVIYTDMRSDFKGYEEFYNRAQKAGAHFVRAKLENRSVTEDSRTKNLIVHAETEAGQSVEIETEMVVLANAAVPVQNAAELARILNIPIGTNGFFVECQPKIRPTDTDTPGIFLAGACQGLKDIPYSVAQGSSAAAQAAAILSKPTWIIEPLVARVNEDVCSGCGICEPVCSYNAVRIKKTDEKELAKVTEGLCRGCGTCGAACPAGAITMPLYTNAQVIAQVRAVLDEMK